MTASFAAFADELTKLSEQGELLPVTRARLLSGVKSLAMHGIGTGIGAALGNVATRELVARYAPSLSPRGQALLGYVGTGLAAGGGLAAAASFAKRRALAEQAEAEAQRRRDKDAQDQEFQAGGPP